MSERLTTRLANGGVGYDNGEYFKVCYPWNENCLSDIDRMAIRLCELEDKIEQGDVVEVVRCENCKESEVCPDTLLWCNQFERLVPRKDIVIAEKGERKNERLRELGTTKEIEKEIVRRETKADTVRQMQARLKWAFNFGHTILEKSICDIIDQIAKEMLDNG